MFNQECIVVRGHNQELNVFKDIIIRSVVLFEEVTISSGALVYEVIREQICLRRQ